MSSFLIGVAGLIAPGFAHGLMSQRRAMAIAIGLVVASIVVALFVPWGAYLSLAVLAGTAVDAGLRHRRLRPNIQWSRRYALIAFGSAIVIAAGARALAIEAFKIPSSAMAPTLQIGDHIFANKLAMRWRGPERGEIIIFRQPCMPRVDYIKRVIALENETVEIRCGMVYVGGAPVPTTLVNAKDRHLEADVDGRFYEQQVSRYRETLGGHSFEVFHDVELPGRNEARRAGGAEAEDERGDFPGETPRSCSNLPPGEGGLEASNQQSGKIVETDPAPADPCKPHRHYVVPPGHVFAMGDYRDNSNDSRFWGPVPVENVKGVATGIWLPLGRIGRLE